MIQESSLNHERAEAFRLLPEEELYAAVVTSSLNPKFYETAQSAVERIADLVGRVDPQFVARLAIYARNEMMLRSVPLLLVVELARHHRGDDLVSRVIDRVVLRADEISELLACYQWRNPKEGVKKLSGLSHQIQVGLQRAFNRFSEYEFAKYDRDSVVKLRDALFIVHPKPASPKQQAIFDKIVSDDLAVPYTWETELSALGQQQFGSADERKAAFRAKWEELIESGKIGYMALLRNLRNMLEIKVSDHAIDVVANRLADSEAVEHSRQFPFRFLAAYKELMPIHSKNTAPLLTALEKAAIVASEHVNIFGKDDTVFIANDMSGSMQHPISPRSKIWLYEVGLMLSMMLQRNCHRVISGIFGSEWQVVNLPSVSILANAAATTQLIGKVGYGTEGHKPLEWLVEQKIVVDRVMFFTDCQFWGVEHYGGHFKALWDEYKKISPKAKIYLFDLAGYGHSPIRIDEEDVFIVAGWNERVFDVVASLENSDAVLDKIRSIEL